MKIPHPQLQAALQKAVEAVTPNLKISFRAMFGGAGAYAYGQYFASLSDVGLALKLPSEAQAELLKMPGAKRLQYDDSMPPSKQYIVVPETTLHNPERLGVWVTKSLAYVSTLPAKPKKKGANNG